MIPPAGYRPRERCAVCLGDIFFHLHAGSKFRVEQGFAEGDIHRPREGVRLQHGVTVEPWIATEDFVSTFTGQRDLVMLRNLPTEIQQR